jgi:uncharacterized phage protein (TIGR01671 family)
MREIKFRAWHFALKKMFSSEEMTKDQMAILPDGYFANIHGSDTAKSIIYDHDEMLPLQFTGLKDKNGKEIYEGDICKRILDRDNRFKHEEEWADFWLIEWLTPACGFTTTLIGDLENGKIKPVEYLRRNSFSQRFNEMNEVIGNIYENPEFLKEAQ